MSKHFTINPRCCMSSKGRIKARYQSREEAGTHIYPNSRLRIYECTEHPGTFHLATRRSK